MALALIFGKGWNNESFSVCKGKNPKGTEWYEGGKENTEWLYTSFIPDNQISLTILHAIEECHLNVTGFIGKWGSDKLSDLLNSSS